jgi:hypothetical protein
LAFSFFSSKDIALRRLKKDGVAWTLTFQATSSAAMWLFTGESSETTTNNIKTFFLLRQISWSKEN